MDIYIVIFLKFKIFRVLRRFYLEMFCEIVDCLCLFLIFKFYFFKSCNIRSIIIIILIEEVFK